MVSSGHRPGVDAKTCTLNQLGEPMAASSSAPGRSQFAARRWVTFGFGFYLALSGSVGAQESTPAIDEVAIDVSGATAPEPQAGEDAEHQHAPDGAVPETDGDADANAAPAVPEDKPARPAIAVPMIRLQPALPAQAVQVQVVEAIEMQPANLVGAAVAIGGNPVHANEPNLWIRLDQDGWKFWDGAEAPAENWFATDFDDSKWHAGSALLGYGDADIKTTLSFGEKPEAKPLVAYFRFTFELAELPEVATVAGRLICDDGAVIYLNGKEIHRKNLPEGNPTHETVAVTALSDGEERAAAGFLGDPAAPLHKGKNTIAVRVHQANASSSDLAFALELRGVDEKQAAEFREQIEKEAVKAVEAQAAVVVQQVELQQQVAVQARSYIHLSDGTFTYMDANGQTRTQHIDAIEQIASFAPQAKFARAMEGDTLAKLARQNQVPLDRLATLNRRSADRPFADNEIFCLSWTYSVVQDDTLAKVASIFVTSPETIAKLNGLDANAQLTAGQELQVPGEFTYHHQGNSSYVQLAQYAGVQGAARQMPYKPETQELKREQAPEAQTLAEYAKSQDLSAKQLAIMNGLEEDSKLEKGQWILIEFSVELNEGGTIGQIAQMMSLEPEKIRLANNLAENAEPQAGQRIQIPIGERLNQTTGVNGVARPSNEVSVLEVRLGDLQ